MHVVEEVLQLGGIPADVVVEGFRETLGEELGALGGHDADVRWGAGRHHGQDLREEVAPVLALDGHDPHRDVGVGLVERPHQTGARFGVLGGAEDRDGQGVGPAAGNVLRGQPRPGRGEAQCSGSGEAQQCAATEVGHDPPWVN